MGRIMTRGKCECGGNYFYSPAFGTLVCSECNRVIPKGKWR